nr:Gfo/Idh/MocA family oxidoreductase [Parablautia muri]
MGKRRIRLLQRLIGDVHFVCVDRDPRRLEQARKAGHQGHENLGQAIDHLPDLAFVCTSPGHHAEIILQLVNARINVFTELNLVDKDYDSIMAKAEENKTTIFMSSTMLYDKRIMAIDKIVKKHKKPVTYIYHVGQYLPDWHPWESYKDFFIGKKETNGVREIYAIQMPWLIDTFGKINAISSISQKCTDLDIDFSDSIIASFKHDNGNIGVFAVDIVSRKATTHLEIIGEDIHLFWGGHNDDLFIYESDTKKMKPIETYDSIIHEEGYSDNIIENRYEEEIRDFLSMVYKHTKPRYSLEDDKYTLKIIDKIEGRIE